MNCLSSDLPRSWRRRTWKDYHRYCRLAAGRMRALVEFESLFVFYHGRLLSEPERVSFLDHWKKSRSNGFLRAADVERTGRLQIHG